MRSADTSPEAEDRQFEIQGRLGGAGRFELAYKMSNLMRNVSLSRIRSEHPDYSQEEVVRAYVRDVLLLEIPARKT